MESCIGIKDPSFDRKQLSRKLQRFKVFPEFLIEFQSGSKVFYSGLVFGEKDPIFENLSNFNEASIEIN